MIHPQAIVSSSDIGDGSSVWQFASVIRGAKIGKNCSIGACSVLDGATVGDGCSIGHGAQIHPGTTLGNDVFVGPGAIFCNDKWPSTSKEGFALKGGSTVIVDTRASIGAGAIILPGVRIGAGSLVAAGAACNRDVPAASVFFRDGTIGPMPDDTTARRMAFAK